MSLPEEKTRLRSSKIKRFAVEQVLNRNKSVSQVARELGVARKTVYSWLKRYKETPSRSKHKSFENRYVEGNRHPKAVAGKALPLLKRLIVLYPNWGCRKYSEELNKRGIDLGYFGVHQLLKSLDASTPDLRKNFKRSWSGPGRLETDIKLEIVNKVLSEEMTVSRAAKEYGVARKTIYQWIKKYQVAIEKNIVGLEALKEAYVKGEDHPRSVYPQLQDRLLGMVAREPELSVHRLANRLPASSWTVWSVLDRNNLNSYEQRLAFSQTQKGAVSAPVPEGFVDRVRYILEQFVPSLAPAPPPRSVYMNVARLFKPFFASLLLVCLFSYGALSWIRIISQATSLSSAIGLVFASMALLMGSFFFLYSFKYYITLALVLSFSQTEGIEDAGDKVGGRRKVLSWLFGLNGESPTSPGATRGKAVGLTPNLEHIKLKRYPKVSIHIPFYNEKNVVERAIRAVTNFDYPGEYEAILCDDSTDRTSNIIRAYQEKYLPKNTRLQRIENKEEGWTLTEVEIRPGVVLKHLHRTSRSGYKGGALRLALRVTDPKVEFVSIFDADFVPYPDTLELFLKYFQATAGTLDFRSQMLGVGKGKRKDNLRSTDLGSKISNIAVVQGYQWHVLNKSENWITRGIRSEYAGSYVIERSGTEIYGGLKMISGAVYMIRRDVLEEVGWETSITEDFQLTLKLYEKGYKVVYTPYIQAPAECVSTLKRLIRQRMRWAEGHSNNVRKMFWRLLVGKWEQARKPTTVNGKSKKTPNDGLRFTDYQRQWVPSPLTISEKLEFLYLGPYYLQAFFFLVGTISWLISETLFPARLPFWTSLWGWSLVLTNMLSLPLMNAVGMFLEESEEKDYAGLPSFIALSYIVVPFQAYAAVKGFFKGEGPWFRTPKTGRITDILKRGTFYRFISGILPGRSQVTPAHAQVVSRKPTTVNRFTSYELPFTSKYLALATANSQFNSFKVKPKRNRYIAKLALFLVVGLSSVFSYFGSRVPQGSITNLPIQARIEVTKADNSVVSQAVNLLKPKDALASSAAETILTGTSRSEVLGAVFILTVILSFAFLIYLVRRKRKLVRKIIRPLFVVALVFSWLLASWPPILTNPRFPPRIKEAKATANLLVNTSTSGTTDAPSSWGDVTSLTGSADVAGTGSVLILMAHVPLVLTSTDEVAQFRFTVDGDSTGSPITVGYSDDTSEGHSMTMYWAVDGLSASSHDFAVQWQQLTGVAQTHSSQTRTFQVIELESDVSILVDTSATSTDTAATSWANMPSLSDTVSVTASSLLLFITSGHVPAGADDVGAELRFAIDGTRAGPYAWIWSDNASGPDVQGTSFMWAETGVSGASHTLSVQWQDGSVAGLQLQALNRTFQVIQLTNGFNLGVDVESTSSETRPTSYADMDEMSGNMTPDSSDSVVLMTASGVIDDTSDASALLRLAYDSMQEGAEITTFADEANAAPGWSLTRAKTGITGSHDFSLQWNTGGSGTAVTDTGRERVFQVIDFKGVAVPSAPTLYNEDGGSNQIAFNNIKENDTTPIVRASATHTASFNRFQVEFNTASNFGGTAYTETFSGTYSSGTAYNLQTTGTLNLPSTDGVTYYVRARASANGGTDYGPWSTTITSPPQEIWTYTYTSSGGDPEWFQTTDEQFDTGTLSDTSTNAPSDRVKLAGGGGPIAVAVNGSPTAALRDGTSQWTLSHNSPTGSYTMLIVSVTLTNDLDQTVDTVTYNGDDLDQISRVEMDDDAVVDMWYRLSPDTGTNTVEVNFTGTVGPGTLGAISFTGVDQGDPFGTPDSDSGDLNPIYVTVSSETNGMVFSGVACETCTSFSVDDEDEQWNLNGGTELGAASTQAGATSVEMRWTTGTTDHDALLAVPINPVDVPAWYDSDWQYRKPITIDGDQVGSGGVSNFPVLINLSSDTELAASACNSPSAGYDILFTSSTGTKLSHEIETFSDSTGALVAWVKVASLTNPANTTIYMYYGNSGCANQQDAANVWTSYVGVWHLKESSGSGYYIQNSVQDDYHANEGSTNYFSGSIIDGGRDLNASICTVENGTDLLDSDTAFTVEFWAYPDYASDGDWQAESEDMFLDAQSMSLCRWWSSGTNTGTMQCDVHWSDSSTTYQNSGSYVVRAQWNHIVLTYDGANISWYVNGVQRGSNSESSKTLETNDHLYFGGSYAMNSNFDEYRYLRDDLSAGWITTEYNNQGTPGDFYNVGIEEEEESPTSGTIMSTEIDFDWFDGASAWNDVYWSEDQTHGTIMVQVYYNNCGTLVPDDGTGFGGGCSAATNTTTGFATSPIDISCLSTSTYNEICIRATLTDSGGTPYLEDWGVTVPEYSFLLLGIAPLLPGFIGRVKRRKNLLRARLWRSQ